MKVLILAHENTANVPGIIQRMLNQTPGWECQLVVGSRNYLNFQGGLLFNQDIDAKGLSKLIEEADVVHLNACSFGDNTADFMEFSVHLPRLVGKKVIRHGHGLWTRKHYSHISMITRQTGIINIVATPDLLHFIPGSKLLPNPVDLEQLPYNPLPMEDKIRICHAPTNPAIKSTQAFEEAMEIVCQQYPDVEYVPIQGLSHQEALKIKSTCHFQYDQFLLQCYGVSSIEAMAMGLLSFVGHARYKPFYDLLQGTDFPAVDVNQEYLGASLSGWIKKLGRNPSHITHKLEEARRWVERVHDARVVTAQLRYLYQNTPPMHQPTDVERVFQHTITLVCQQPTFYHASLSHRLRKRGHRVRIAWQESMSELDIFFDESMKLDSEAVIGLGIVQLQAALAPHVKISPQVPIVLDMGRQDDLGMPQVDASIQDTAACIIYDTPQDREVDFKRSPNLMLKNREYYLCLKSLNMDSEAAAILHELWYDRCLVKAGVSDFPNYEQL